MTGIAPIGAKQVLLAPCVWFFCGSPWCRNIVKRVAQDLAWLGLYGIHDCRFELGGAVLAASQEESTSLKDWSLDIKLEHGIRLSDQFTTYLHIQDPDNSSEKSAIGLLCCATVTQNGTIISQKLASVAGVLEVEGLSCGKISLGLTTCHNLVDACIDPLYQDHTLGGSTKSHHDIMPTQGTRETTDADSFEDSDEDNDEDSDDDCFTDGFEDETLATTQKTISVTNSKWTNVSRSVSGSFVGFKFGPLTQQQPGWTSTRPFETKDLAVFKLPPEGAFYNTYRKPPGTLISIKSHLSDDHLGLDEVLIINDLEAVTQAYPLVGTMHFCIRGEILETVRLKYIQPLST